MLKNFILLFLTTICIKAQCVGSGCPGTGSGGSGTVTSVSGTSPLTGTITSSGSLACATCEVSGHKDTASGYAGLDSGGLLKVATECPAGTGSVTGCIAAADWTTFNNKVSKVGSVTTNGSTSWTDVQGDTQWATAILTITGALTTDSCQVNISGGVMVYGSSPSTLLFAECSVSATNTVKVIGTRMINGGIFANSLWLANSINVTVMVTR